MTARISPNGYSLANIDHYVGRVFGPSEPIALNQTKIQQFADATGDQQWIHVDVERAKAESPFCEPIAHGFLTLSLVAAEQIKLGLYPHDAPSVMNYGLDKVRFLAPVPSGAEVTVTATLTSVEHSEEKRIIVRAQNIVQIVDAPKPAVIAETIAMVFT